MRYLITLKPLEPFLFGGDQTFGALGDKEAGTYLVKSRQFPQQTALLGMLKKEMMTQAGFLTRKRKGEWVDKEKKSKTIDLVGKEKFDMCAANKQNFGAIKRMSPVFLMKDGKPYIKKADIDTYPYEDGKLGNNYSGKVNIYDNFISLDGKDKKSASDIFMQIEQTGNKKGGEENSLFKKYAYLLKDDFSFAYYLDVDFALKNGLVTLGADRSSFMMTVTQSDADLDYIDKKGYMTLLSDAYITVPLKDNAAFAISSELSHRNLTGLKGALAKHTPSFKKTDSLYLYEKGTVIIAPSAALLDNLNNENLQQIGYNIYSIGENK